MSRTLLKLADDEYVEWSSNVDAPVTHVMTRAEALASHGAERVERTDQNGHSAMWHGPRTAEDYVVGNRAGPGEATLTLEALRRRYHRDAPPEDEDPLRPEEIQPYTSSYANHPEISSDRIFWVPWRPGEAPDEITEETDLKAMVEMTPEEVAEWNARHAESGATS